jgi:glycosyltransferase involved in cell wall biosynthesis
VKQDIHKRLNTNTEKIQVIYNPIIQAKEFEDFQRLSKQFRVEKYEYFYTVSSLAPHKNTEVLIRLIARLKDKKPEQIPIKLLISGIKGSQASYLKNLANDLDVLEEIIFTGFVSNAVRNTLYKYAYAFLFPSTFEGFGMPPVEAMMHGTPVITTKCASIPEVTQNKCKYVNEPTRIEEWEERVLEIGENERKARKFPDYDLENVTKQMTELFFLTVAKTSGN